MSHDKTPIMAAMHRIRDAELVLPAIQRDFVWSPARIYALLDSIMRGYPFGTLLFWNTKQRAQYRRFSESWSNELRYTYEIKEQGARSAMVLDGQQRLQALYLALFGSYEQKKLYLDLLSGVEHDDVSEARYRFSFLSLPEAAQRADPGGVPQLWVPLADVVNIPNPAVLHIRTDAYRQQAGVTTDSPEGQRLAMNLSTAFFRFRAEELLNYYTIDKEYGDDGVLTALDEVLEIFVRVNSGGQILSKSDLMFSLMQMHWEDAADQIADLVEEMNTKGRFEFDKDFVLKTALVCVGRGAKYDVAKLRDKETLEAIKSHFPAIRGALVSCVDLAVNTAKLQDGRVLASYNTLIPFAYFLFRQSAQHVPNESTRLAMSQALYLALMTRAFSRYADQRIDQMVHDIFDPYALSSPGLFPLGQFCRYIGDREGHAQIDDGLLQNNIPLLMNILEGGVQLPEGIRRYRAEYDHIFPQAGLRQRGYSEDKINHYANFRLIAKDANIWKRDQDPAVYFGAHSDLIERYHIPGDLLDYAQYEQFLEARRDRIWQRVDAFLGIKPGETPADGVELPLPHGQPVVAPEPGLTPPRKHSRRGSNRTGDELCQLADASGIGVPFRRILERAQELGLRARPYTWVIMYAPPKDARRFLFYIEVRRGRQGQLQGWISPGRFHELLGVPKEVAETLGPGGSLEIAPDEVDSFLQKLTIVMQHSNLAG